MFSIVLSFILLSFSQTESIPEQNALVFKLAQDKIGKKVDRGECWDLAKYVLDKSNSEWKPLYDFGTIIDQNKETIFPGDIIQFEGVKIERKEKGKTVYYETFEHHTAIVYSVEDKNKIKLIHQNTGQFGRKVGVSDFNFSEITKKKSLTIYRPIAKENL